MEARTEEGLSSGYLFCSLEIALLDEGLCRCRKIAVEIQQRVGRELGVAAFRLEGGGGGEHIEQIRTLPVGGGADTRTILTGATPLAFLANSAHQFPAMRRENLFPTGKLVKQVSRTSRATGRSKGFDWRGGNGRKRGRSRLRSCDLIKSVGEGEEEGSFRRSNGRDGCRSAP